jgi:hypothetical protein
MTIADRSDTLWDETAVRTMWPLFWKLHRPGVLAASIVHLWLPGFAILAHMLRVFNRWGRKRESLDKDVRGYLGVRHPMISLGILAGLMAYALVNLKLFAWVIGW